jgi:phosphoglycerate dehydrogenase-like enzyme
MNFNDSRPNEWKVTGSVSPKLKDAEGRPPHTLQNEVVGLLGYGQIGRLNPQDVVTNHKLTVIRSKNCNPLPRTGL